MNPSEVITEGGKLVTRAGDFGPNAFLTALVILLIAGGVGAWFWWVIRPQQEAKLQIDKANADTNATLAKTLAAMSTVVNDTHAIVSNADGIVRRTHDRSGRMLRTHEIEFRILRKMAKNHPADVAEDLAALEAMLQSAAFDDTWTGPKNGIDEKPAAEAR